MKLSKWMLFSSLFAVLSAHAEPGKLTKDQVDGKDLVCALNQYQNKSQQPARPGEITEDRKTVEVAQVTSR